TESATSSSPSADARSRASLRKFASQDFVDLSRVRLTASRLHRLTHKEVQGLLLASAKLRYLSGIGGDDVLHQLLDFRAVRDLTQPAALDDGIGFQRAVPHLIEYLSGGFARDSVAQDVLEQSCLSRVADRGSRHIDSGPIERCAEFAQHPAGRELVASAQGAHQRFVESGQFTGCGE